MRVRVLGPLEVNDGSGWHRVGAAKQRALLGGLLARPGRTASMDRLIEDVWNDSPPANPVNMIYVYAARLRKILGDSQSRILRSHPPGYQLGVEDDEVDAGLFERLAEEGEAALAAGDHDAAAATLREALRLWRGAAFADIPLTATVQAEAVRLEERRLVVLEARVDADLARGRHADLVAELRAAVGEHMYRERLWAQLMLALYRSGRQAEALEAYQQIYRLLDEELGVEPGRALQERHQEVLRSAPTLDLEPAEPTPRKPVRQMPGDLSDFTARRPELRWLDDRLEESRHGVMIAAISGIGGLGKTTLAVRWAHRVADRFPDGQFYVNLRGYATAAPLEPIEGLGQVLRALGVDPGRIPADVDEASGLYRSLVADRRMLILLDDASDPQQVRPLVPAGPGSAVVITSRDRLVGLVATAGVVRLDLDPLDADAGSEVLEKALGKARIESEPGAASRLVELCGGLPLALRMMAATIDESHASLTTTADNLSRGDRLTAFGAEGDSIRAVFGMSYERASEQERRVFRLCTVVPGVDFTPEAVAAVTGVRPDDASRLLGRLVGRNLLQRRGPNRFGFHDLVRLYAAERFEADESDEVATDARIRLYEWYLQTARQAVMWPLRESVRLPPNQGAPNQGAPTREESPALEVPEFEAPVFADKDEARAWLDAEQANLVTAVHAAKDAYAWRLGDILRAHFRLGRHFGDWLAVSSEALAVATEHGNLLGMASAELNLAQVHRYTMNFPAALEHSRRSHEYAVSAGWHDAASTALAEQAWDHVEQGRPDTAVELLERGIRTNRAEGRPFGLFVGLINLGWTYYLIGRLHPAEEVLIEALSMRADVEDYLRAVPLGFLGETYRGLGRLDLAEEYLRGSFEQHVRAGNLRDIPYARLGLAGVHLDRRELGAARRIIDEVAAQVDGWGDRRAAHRILTMRGEAALLMGDHDGALADFNDAIQLSDASSLHYGHAPGRIGLASAYRGVGDLTPALRSAAQAVELASGGGYRIQEAQARSVLSAVRLDLGERDFAFAEGERALALHVETGHRPGEARTLKLLAEIVTEQGNAEEAEKLRQQAYDLFAEIAMPA